MDMFEWIARCAQEYETRGGLTPELRVDCRAERSGEPPLRRHKILSGPET